MLQGCLVWWFRFRICVTDSFYSIKYIGCFVIHMDTLLGYRYHFNFLIENRKKWFGRCIISDRTYTENGISRHAWLLPDRGIYIAWSWNTKPCTIRVHLIKGIKWDITRKENKKKIFIWICQKYIIYGYHRKDYLTIMNSRRIIPPFYFFFW